MNFRGRAHALAVIGVSAALFAGCGDEQTEPSASVQVQARAAEQTTAEQTTAEQTGSEAAAKADEPGKGDQRARPDADDSGPALGGTPTCAEAKHATDEVDGCRARDESPPAQSSGDVSPTKDENSPPPVDPNGGRIGREPGKPTLGAEQEHGSPTKDADLPPLVDPNSGTIGEEPNKPTLGAEQEHYTNAEIECDQAAETPEAKDACYAD
jgi:hypothetical protein